MTSVIVILPSAPALLPENVGQVDPLAAQRDAISRALAQAVSQFPQGSDFPGAILVAASDRDPHWSGLSLGERVGRHLLDEAGVALSQVVTVPTTSTAQECADLGAGLSADSARLIVVVADGSARRSPKAPGHLDERAAAFDDALVAAVSKASRGDLLALDPALAKDLLAQGRSALQVAAGAIGEHAAYRCVFLEVSDPFGVLYVVAVLVSDPP